MVGPEQVALSQENPHGYSRGLGIQQNTTEAIAYYRKAAKQGFPKALMILGHYYSKGCQGFPQDTTLAVTCFRKAAEHGWMDAQSRLADCYYYGHGVQGVEGSNPFIPTSKKNGKSRLRNNP